MAVAIASGPRREQCLSALELADAVRITRAAWKRQLREGDRALGRAQVATRLLDCAPEIQTMLVASLLKCAPGVGPKKVPRIMFSAGVAAGWRVHQLTERQRTVLAEMLCRPVGTVSGVR